VTRAPDFEDLVGSDLEPTERARLQRVHDLLVEAGPPPELAAELGGAAPAAATVHARARRRLRALALAAAFGALVFALGFVAGDRANDYGTFRVEVMTGSGAAEGASARIEIFDKDDAGNWPMELDVSGLMPPASGRLYELWLTRDGQPAAFCGSFLADPDGRTLVPLNAPWRLDEFDGWVVVETGSTSPLLGT
jgi:Anti-sigma-K factor rskA